MTFTYMTQVLPVSGGTEIEVARAINQVLDGKLNSKGEVTLTASSATTVVNDVRAASESVILFMPITANAAAEVGAGGMYISARTNGSFTITHANNAQIDRNFVYVVIG